MKLSPVIDLCWRVAVLEASAARSEFLEPEHFLQAITKGRDFCRPEVLEEMKARGFQAETFVREFQLVPDALDASGVDPTKLRRLLRAAAGVGGCEHASGAVLHRSELARQTFAAAEALASETGDGVVTAPILFVALAQSSSAHIQGAIRQMGSGPEAIVKEVLSRWRGGKEPPAQELPATPPAKAPAAAPVARQAPVPILTQLGRDLTQAAKDGLLAPVIGRRKELLQVIQTLTRSTKSNPVLVGEPGVGKTAIVEALAQRIVDGKDTQVLGGKRIVEITMGSLIAGAKLQGDFEGRIKRLLEEAKADPSLILFIDEIHTLIGAGGPTGGLDAANLLKPALARGEITCIGATTLVEYRKYIESDAALERRFDKIIVEEPSRDDAVHILEGMRPRLEKHHRVRITDDAIQAAVDLSLRFDSDHRLPDKAIDLIDLACARVLVPELSLRGDHRGGQEGAFVEVLPAAVVAVLSEKTGIPAAVIAGEIKGGAPSKLNGLRERLGRRLFGQDAAVDRVCQRLLMAQAALSERRGPLGVFLFLGPSGVGKTELARALAAELFGSESKLIRLDMSEYMDKFSVARLIGAPPGYIGHDEEGQLTGKLRTTPHTIVLLDEVEKADPRVVDVFLQVFDEGRITDSKGRTADARNAIFVMTSNIGSTPPAAGIHVGFGAQKSVPPDADGATIAELKQHFRVELINRIDEIIRFAPLSAECVSVIIRKTLDGLVAAVRAKYGKDLTFDEAVVPYLCRVGYSAEFGARNMRRIIEEAVQIPLTQVLASANSPWSRINCSIDSGKVILKAD